MVQLIVATGVAAALIVVGGALAGTATYVCWVAALAAETRLPRLAARTPLLAGAPGSTCTHRTSSSATG